MKRLVCFLLATIMLVSSGVISAFAQSTPFTPQYADNNQLNNNSNRLFFDKLYDQYIYLLPPEEIEQYDELYYHTDDNGEIDWALVYIYYDSIVETVVVRGILGGKTIYLPGPEYPFTIRYGLYDVTEGKFYDLWNNSLFDQYDGLFEAWQSIDTSEIEPEKYLGDANGDNSVDIIDATYIQRFDAKIISRNDIAHYQADFDGNGEIDVIDATRIQRLLVKE